MSNAELFSQIKNLKNKELIFVFGVFLAVLAPGFLTLYQFKPQVVLEYSSVKVFVFSLAISLPVFFSNFLVFGVLSTRGIHEDQTLSWSASLFVTMLSFYVSLFFSYFLGSGFLAFLAFLFLINFMVFFSVLKPFKKVVEEG